MFIVKDPLNTNLLTYYIRCLLIVIGMQSIHFFTIYLMLAIFNKKYIAPNECPTTISQFKKQIERHSFHLTLSYSDPGIHTYVSV